jgi:hypothetical protein
MRRREFITLLGSTAVCRPIAARAQQLAMPVVGFVDGSSADATEGRIAAFRRGLGETGYAEGRNLTVEYHYIEGQYERLPTLLADLVRRGVAVIATPEITTRDNNKMARLVTSPAYKQLWGDRFIMTKTGERRLENNQSGFKLATSVGGVSTGERGERILLDDPHNVIKAE